VDNKNIPYLFFLYLLFIIGYVFSRGLYSFYSVATLSLVLILSLLFAFYNKKIIPIKDLPSTFFMEKFVLILSIIFTLILYGGYYQRLGILSTVSLIFIFICLLLVTIEPKIKNIFYIILFLYTLTGVFMLLTSPSPSIDVFVFLKEGAVGLLRGLNPYSMIFSPITNNPFYKHMILDFYSYFPGTILLTIPGMFIGNDPRYSMLIAQVVSSLLLYKQFKNYYLSLIFLFNPLSLLILEQSWTEPLMVMLLVFSVVSFLRKQYFYFILSFGLFLASKQYGLLFLPMFLLLLKDKLALILKAIFVSLLIILPFVYWNSKDFIHDAIALQLILPFRSDGLTLTSFIYKYTGLIIPPLIINIAWILSGLYIYIKSRNTRNDAILFNTFCFLFLFFFVNKWSFANYYYLLSSFLLLIIAVMIYQKRD
jgi:hypothetical protein